ncbi:DUF305 domain-containing protein [Pseudonocardia sp. MH-G8]|uniref:DUF305 domain-containing protein n=1 Tax=Pseudonocardia sp. MH-G8 TaxID=1854588 RepID=UPI000BA016FE|nr:DUF305 domain-containing protein [Pseudonocardia sp. MH-G8]OZM76397.1 DUF305 domain-containing protein [Pseudonocardia sp. MH-G8]
MTDRPTSSYAALTGGADGSHPDERPVGAATPDESATGATGQPRWPRVVIVTGTLLALLLLAAAGGVVLGRSGSDGLAVPPADSVDVGFLQDMSVHHENAVQMAAWARDNSADPAVRQLAYDIESGQTAQVGQMRGWLVLWGAPAQSLSGYMRWMTDAEMGMGHTADGVARMPGMASSDDLARLRGSVGPAADVMFLQLMLRHHEGGVPMLGYAMERAARAEVRNLARQMLTAQTAESQVMRQMLTERGAAPLS